MRYKLLLFLVASLLSTYIQAQTLNRNKPSDPSLVKGKGSFSCKINGQFYQSSPGQAKCWTSTTVPMALLWAKGEQIDVSCQLQAIGGKGIYRINGDSSGMVSFTIRNNIYWIRTAGRNYLTITLTGIKEIQPIKLLSGTFEGVLEDKNGNQIKITEGRFITDDV